MTSFVKFIIKGMLFPFEAAFWVAGLAIRQPMLTLAAVLTLTAGGVWYFVWDNLPAQAPAPATSPTTNTTTTTTTTTNTTTTTTDILYVVVSPTTATVVYTATVYAGAQIYNVPDEETEFVKAPNDLVVEIVGYDYTSKGWTLVKLNGNLTAWVRSSGMNMPDGTIFSKLLPTLPAPTP